MAGFSFSAVGSLFSDRLLATICIGLDTLRVTWHDQLDTLDADSRTLAVFAGIAWLGKCPATAV